MCVGDSCNFTMYEVVPFGGNGFPRNVQTWQSFWFWSEMFLVQAFEAYVCLWIGIPTVSIGLGCSSHMKDVEVLSVYFSMVSVCDAIHAEGLDLGEVFVESSWYKYMNACLGIVVCK